MTNHEWILNMSVDELADFLNEVECGDREEEGLDWWGGWKMNTRRKMNEKADNLLVSSS